MSSSHKNIYRVYKEKKKFFKCNNCTNLCNKKKKKNYKLNILFQEKPAYDKCNKGICQSKKEEKELL